MSQVVEILSELSEEQKKILLTDGAMDFLEHLHKKFNKKRLDLLRSRQLRQQTIDAGEFPSFRVDSENIRNSKWQVAKAPKDLLDRRVEITGPVDRKMMITAFNSGAKVFMADLEDSLSPSWKNIIEGQINLYKAVRRQLDFVADSGKSYKLKSQIATLVVRPRGWHLEEEHVKINDQNMSGSLFDFGLFFYHNAKELLSRGSGPYFYLPKLENADEARLWNDVFNEAQDYCEIARGSIRATVLVETILAAFEMEEILFELKEHVSGMNAGRWDYIFSIIKRFSKHSQFVMPDRNKITMTVPFMRAYTKLLVQTCHKRGAHAIGGMSAFVPSRRDEQINTHAIVNVRADKLREAEDGFDGTWVAHPDLVAVAKDVFDNILGSSIDQKELRQAVDSISSHDLIMTDIVNENITEEGLRNNIAVALQYLSAWIGGLGAVAINNLMEDAATAEIARAQIWQWINHRAQLADGRSITSDLYNSIKKEEIEKFYAACGKNLRKAETVLDDLVLGKQFKEFLTSSATNLIDA
jgi:malate synthase